MLARAVYILVAWVALIVPAQGQTHECDVAQATTFALTSADLPKIYFCQPQTITVNGVAIALPIDGAIIKLDGVDLPPYPATLVSSQPSASGKVEYLVVLDRTVAKGNHAVLVRAFNMNTTVSPPTRQEGPQAGPFVLNVGDPPPPVPVIPTAVVIKR